MCVNEYNTFGNNSKSNSNNDEDDDNKIWKKGSYVERKK